MIFFLSLDTFTHLKSRKIPKELNVTELILIYSFSLYFSVHPCRRQSRSPSSSVDLRNRDVGLDGLHRSLLLPVQRSGDDGPRPESQVGVAAPLEPHRLHDRILNRIRLRSLSASWRNVAWYCTR